MICICFGSIFLLFSLCFIYCENVQAEEKDETSYIITAKDDIAYQELIEEYQDQLNELVSGDMEKDGVLVISTEENDMQQLKADVRVESVEEDILVRGCSENTRDNKNIEWNLDAINVVPNNEIQSDSKIKVAIIDSGIDYNEDIDVKERKNFISGQDNVSVLYEDSTGHGTGIAGLWQQKIMILELQELILI